jgi:hypothetical protein
MIYMYCEIDDDNYLYQKLIDYTCMFSIDYKLMMLIT